MLDHIQKSIQAHLDLVACVHEDFQIQKNISRAADILMSAFARGNKVLWCGNGGSAADCQHLSAELVAKLDKQRPALASLALTTDTSYLTAWANDNKNGDALFSRQIEALGNKGDVLMALSTSGNSANIIKAVKTAQDKGLLLVVFCGKGGGALKNTGDANICIPSDNTQRIQEMHILAGHIICECVENSLLSS